MSDDDTLRALEERVIDLVERRVVAIATALGAVISQALAVREARRVPYSATEIFSRPDVDAALTGALASASTGVVTVVTAGYRAGARTATTTVHAELDAAGLDPPPAPDLGDTLPAITTAATTAFANARLEITGSVRSAYDPLVATATPPAILAATVVAIDRAVRRVAVHARAAATVAVHRGYTDAQLALYRAVAAANTHLRLVKRWVADSTDQCPACRALDGVRVELAEEFDATATTDASFTPPKVYLNLLGPPRHPHCRCRLVIEPSTATARLQKALDTLTVPGGYTYLTAAEVRDMPAPAYRAITGFLTAAIARVRHLSESVHRG